MPAVLLLFSFVYSNSWKSLEESGFPSGIPVGSGKIQGADLYF